MWDIEIEFCKWNINTEFTFNENKRNLFIIYDYLLENSGIMGEEKASIYFWVSKYNFILKSRPDESYVFCMWIFCKLNSL